MYDVFTCADPAFYILLYEWTLKNFLCLSPSSLSLSLPQCLLFVFLVIFLVDDVWFGFGRRCVIFFLFFFFAILFFAFLSGVRWHFPDRSSRSKDREMLFRVGWCNCIIRRYIIMWVFDHFVIYRLNCVCDGKCFSR